MVEQATGSCGTQPERLSVEGGLRRAVERSEFVLHYQPRVDGRTGKVVATGAPLRWQDPVHGLRGLGVSVAVDDFGTGFSSLAYLKDFSVDALKVDQAFVRGVPGDTKNAAITCAIIDLAKRLSLSVIAEGVETDAQRRFLQTNGCHAMQGFFFSRPVEPTVFESWWRSR